MFYTLSSLVSYYYGEPTLNLLAVDEKIVAGWGKHNLGYSLLFCKVLLENLDVGSLIASFHTFENNKIKQQE